MNFAGIGLAFIQIQITIFRLPCYQLFSGTHDYCQYNILNSKDKEIVLAI